MRGDHGAGLEAGVGQEPGLARHRRPGAARVRDHPHRRRRADTAFRAADPLGGVGRPPRDCDALPPRRALPQGARDPEGGGFLEGAQPAWGNRRVGGERGSGTAQILDAWTPRRLGVSASIAHAEGGTRTPTGLRPLAPEASASTSSTTSARWRNGEYRRRYNLKSTLGLTALATVSILRWPGGKTRHRP